MESCNSSRDNRRPWMRYCHRTRTIRFKYQSIHIPFIPSWLECNQNSPKLCHQHCTSHPWKHHHTPISDQRWSAPHQLHFMWGHTYPTIYKSAISPWIWWITVLFAHQSSYQKTRVDSCLAIYTKQSPQKASSSFTFRWPPNKVTHKLLYSVTNSFW